MASTQAIRSESGEPCTGSPPHVPAHEPRKPAPRTRPANTKGTLQNIRKKERISLNPPLKRFVASEKGRLFTKEDRFDRLEHELLRLLQEREGQGRDTVRRRLPDQYYPESDRAWLRKKFDGWLSAPAGFVRALQRAEVDVDDEEAEPTWVKDEHSAQHRVQFMHHATPTAPKKRKSEIMAHLTDNGRIGIRPGKIARRERPAVNYAEEESSSSESDSESEIEDIEMGGTHHPADDDEAAIAVAPRRGHTGNVDGASQRTKAKEQVGRKEAADTACVLASGRRPAWRFIDGELVVHPALWG
ncbi:hypothetical protein LTR53_011799 [Teratosphaeriaceae sp. CCFEE 6253]|nr:hypothetical protein LTR53_011799 [Teratosphaeriaceae sp. CCFEE 6253]